MLAAACGSSPLQNGGNTNKGGQLTEAEKAYQKYNPMKGAEREQALIEAAKAEGNVLSLYGAANSDQATVDAFTKKYGIKVEWYGSDTETKANKFMEEQQAGRYEVDVMETSGPVLVQIDQAGWLGDYESERRALVPDYAKGPGWTGNRMTVFTAGYNTKLLKPDDLPRSYEDFADPKWKGKISMEITDYDWFWSLNQYYLDKGKTQAELDDMWNKIVANARVVKGHTAQVDLLAPGQFAATLSSFTQSIDRAVEKKAPVAWDSPHGPVEPLVINFVGGAVAKHAPHPAAAMLFLDFTLSDDVLPALAKDNVQPVVELAGKDHPSPIANYQTTPMLIKRMATPEATQWNDKYDALLRKAGQPLAKK
jgi:iron(III) transport system substrate-binding protein